MTTKKTIYLGLNDKDTKTQVISTLEAYKDINQVYEGLRTLWSMVSHKLYSAGAASDEAQEALHYEIIARIDMLQEFYKVSNKTINDILRLAEQKNHFKNYFSSIFSVDDILINPNIDIKKLVTIN